MKTRVTDKPPSKKKPAAKKKPAKKKSAAIKKKPVTRKPAAKKPATIAAPKRVYVPYSPELGDKICELIALQTSFRTIEKMEGMPSISAMFNWLRTYDDFHTNYLIAKEQCADLCAEDLLEIADDKRGDYTEVEDGKFVFNKEAVMRARLRIDTRKWIASKLKPGRYGDKTEITGAGGSPLQITVVHE